MRQLSELKKGFWGYKKESVYRYIVLMEEEVYDKLAQKDAQAAEERAQAERKIQRLEDALASVKAENEELRREQKTASDMLFEAKQYSERLKEETLQREKRAHEEIDEASKKAISELDFYMEKVSQLKETLRSLMQEIDGRVEQAQEEIEEVRAQAPSSKITHIRSAAGAESQEKKQWKKSSFM